jgi:hypothetical protein
LLNSITDALILWSLEETDPQLGKFLTKDQILRKIEAAIPTASQFIRGNIDHHLITLSSKNNPTGREISWYKQLGQYALQYSQRQQLLYDNIEEAELFSSITDNLKLSIRAAVPQKLHNRIDDISQICHRCVQVMFERQGTALGLFIMGTSNNTVIW